MKILYGAGKRPGANLQLKRFLDHCDHEIRFATYLRYSECLPYIDWTLDALKSTNSFDKKAVNNLFGYKSAPHVDYGNAEILLEEIDIWKPDLVISDAENITAHVAKSLEIQLWYCSPLHLLDGIEWDKKQLKYHIVLEKVRKQLLALPNAELTLIYSPFCDISMRPILKPGYEWCKPYFTTPQKLSSVNIQRTKLDSFKYMVEYLPSEHLLTTGETSYLSDAVYAEKTIHIAPTMSDPESLLNANLCENYLIGTDLGEIETNLEYTKTRLDKILDLTFSDNYLSRQNWKQLHEKLK